MMRIVIILLVFIWVNSAQAGFFDDVLNQAKEVTEETIKKTVETVSGDEEKEPTKVQEPNPPPESAPEVSVKQPASKVNPTKDKQLVTEIQQRLKDLGYKVGVVDGLYGPGTRGAIMQYQKQHGMPTDGQPSRDLLAQLDTAVASKPKQVAQPGTAKDSGDPPSKAASEEPGTNNHPTSMRTMVLAVVNLAPNIFEELKDRDQQEFLVTLFPEEDEIRSNKFYWHKKKDELIQRAVAESQNVATVFEVAPWIDNSTHSPQNIKERSNNLRFLFGQYNFEREGFPIYIQKITIPWTRIIGNKKSPVPYRIVGVGPKKEYWLPMPVNKAETFQERFGTSHLWAHYKFRLTNVVTAKDGELHPEYKKYERSIKKGGVVAQRVLAEMEPVIDVVIKDNRLDLYALDKVIDNNTPVIPNDNLHFVTTVQLEGE